MSNTNLPQSVKDYVSYLQAKLEPLKLELTDLDTKLNNLNKEIVPLQTRKYYVANGISSIQNHLKLFSELLD